MTARPRTLAFLVGLLATASGCTSPGSQNEAPPTGLDAGQAPMVTPAPSDGPVVQVTNGTAHHHDYWANKKELPVFSGDVTLRQDPIDHGIQEGCDAIGYAEFDFEDDGDDNGEDGRSDVVYPGTESIRVEISWDASSSASQRIDSLLFSYKPANDPFFHSELVGGGTQDSCGSKVVSGQPFRVPVGPLQFDPAHQRNLSRWKFDLWAYANDVEAVSGLPVYPPRFAIGAVRVEMSILRGNDTPLDPPHPDFFQGETTFPLGRVTGHINASLLADPDPPTGERPLTSPLTYSETNGHDIREITLGPGRIVPIGYTRLLVEACIRYQSMLPKGPTEYGVAYHGADNDEWHAIEPKEPWSNDCASFEILDPDGTMADSPYESTSQWGFRIVPTMNGQANVGFIEGSFEMTFIASK